MRYLTPALLAALCLGACTETTSRAPSVATPTASIAGTAPANAATAPMRTGSAANERACETAVRRETKNPQIVVLSSDESQANTEVIIGVGAQRAKWRCLVSRGKVAEVSSLTDEGFM